MDPDEALRQIRAEIKGYLVRPHGLEDSERLSRLVELVKGLDGWIDSGGFLPKAWGGDPAFPESDERGLPDEARQRDA